MQLSLRHYFVFGIRDIRVIVVFKDLFIFPETLCIFFLCRKCLVQNK
jgi:hypothetical protein